jgi:hypothetical protein
MIRAFGMLALAFGLMATAAGADVKRESATLAGRQVTLHLHTFLTDEERATLRLVMTNAQALAVFAPAGASANSYTALALSPDEGFTRDGAPVGSAQALSGLAAPTEARAAAEAECNRRRAKGAAPCVTVLEVAPAG